MQMVYIRVYLLSHLHNIAPSLSTLCLCQCCMYLILGIGDFVYLSCSVSTLNFSDDMATSRQDIYNMVRPNLSPF